jgi:FtsP/CotA-like multicopper oxidase with cupredoxin domain
VTIEAVRGTPTTVTYVNNLPPNGGQVQKLITVDQSIHWADPLETGMSMVSYVGPPPAVGHLHGGEVPSAFDGGPEAWFTPNGIHGPAYPGSGNSATYTYPNQQEAATLWFHDHALGATRLNVYAGMAAFYLLRDPYDTGKADNPLKLPAGAFEIEMAIQDRQFDTNGQLYWPDGSGPGLNDTPPNPLIHPFWIPEFFGDVMIVNGAPWPYLEVEPRRYRFHLLDGCNARFLELFLVDQATKGAGPPIWVIGTEGGLLDVSVKLNDPAKFDPNKLKPNPPLLLMAPGERYDVIIDFTGLAGKTFILRNAAKAPYPAGDPDDGTTSGLVLMLKVTKPLSSADTTYNPASGQPLRGGSNQMPAIVRLANPATGRLASGVSAQVKRQLTLIEVGSEEGPVEVLVNNSRYDGKIDDTATPIAGSQADRHGNWLTELPKVGSSEIWEIINTTGDAHPIHLHLVQFQLMNRQAFDVTKYRALYDTQFLGGQYGGIIPTLDGPAWGTVNYQPGAYIPGYGPPNNYFQPNAEGALGGNPAVGPFLKGPVITPTTLNSAGQSHPDAHPNEAGWKDTIQANPGQVTRVAVRFTPQDVPISETYGQNLYPFDPTTGPGYVWHCHIVDHEDNEMMRPYHPV